MQSRLASSCIALAVLLAASAAGVPQAPLPPPFTGPLIELTSPAVEPAAEPNLFADRTGQVWLSWLETRPAGGGHAFRLARLNGTSWSAPITVAEGANFLANWADFPSVFVAGDGTIAAHWLERTTGRAAYDIRLRTSRDGGKTWTPVITPHRDQTTTEHGFVSFFDAPGTGLGLVWLDGREMAAHAGSHAGAANMTLRATTIRDGEPRGEVVVDPRVCDCCQTSAARTSDGVLVAYRDRSDKEIRDTSIVRFVNGAWTAPMTVYSDHWEINGCPVNGPAVATFGNSAAVAWFTAVGGTSKVLVAFSTGTGAFSAPVRLDRHVNLGRLAMAMPGPDRVLVASIERSTPGAALVVREAQRDGRTGDPVTVASISPDRSSGFARLALAGRRLVIAWTDVREGAPTRVRIASADLR